MRNKESEMGGRKKTRERKEMKVKAEKGRKT